MLKSNLSTEGLNKLIKQLNFYKDELTIIADEIVSELAKRGISVAQYSVFNDWRQCIDFKYEPKNLGEGELIGKDITLIHRVWYTSGNPSLMNQREAYISPLWMSEYGAGKHALEGHRGTFPGQRNAFKSVWFWYDGNGEKHSSNEDWHMYATRPMYNALVEMMTNADKVVREIFSKYEFDFD